MSDYKMVDINDINKVIVTFVIVIKKVFNYLLGSFKKYFIVAVIVFASCLVVFYYFSGSRQKYYRSTAAIIFHNLSCKVYGDMVVDLNTLATNHSYNALAKVLNLSIDDAKTIISIEGKNLQGIPLQNDHSTDRMTMYFTVTSTSNTVYAPLEKELLIYLNNNPLNMRIRSTDTLRMAEKIVFLDNDINSVDSIIAAYNHLLNNIQYIKDTTSLSVNILSLLSYKDQLEDKRIQHETRIRELRNPVEMVYGFMPTEYPVNDNNNLKRIIGFIINSLIISAITVLLLRIIRETKTES